MRPLTVGMLIVIVHGAAASAAAGPMFMGLADLPGGGFESEAFAVSADGSVVVGKSQGPLLSQAVEWKDGVITAIGSDGLGSSALGVSHDGSIAVGTRRHSDGSEAARWNEGQKILEDLSHTEGYRWKFHPQNGAGKPTRHVPNPRGT